MQIEVGSILEGKVTGIIKFGAFVELPEGKSGMVHISEISNTYVENVSDFLQEGQTVKVKVLAINENGKISLSIKKAAARRCPRAAEKSLYLIRKGCRSPSRRTRRSWPPGRRIPGSF